MEVAAESLTPVTGSRDPRPVQVFCVAIFVAATGAGIALLAMGAPVPALAPVLLLALAVALCVNRFVLFPTEQAATAEAAVILAAVVGFRDGAALLGPLTVALLVGPLDALHWEQRSFLRMAHNAGNRGLSALAAAGAFAAVEGLVGKHTFALALAGVAAAGAFATVDTGLSVALLRLQGMDRRGAIQHVLDVDALTLPIACYGVAAGFLAGSVGWWATALAMVPAAFVPELVLARARWRGALVRDVACGLLVVAVLVALAVVAPVPDAATLAVLVAVAVLAGMELAVDRRAAMPPLLAVVVVAAIVVADGDRAFFAAALVATTGTITAWWGAGLEPRLRVFSGVAVAMGGALFAAALFDVVPASGSESALVAVVAGLAFELAAVSVAASRRRETERMLWTAPLLMVAVGWSFVWRTVGLGGAAVFVFATASAFAGAAWWGAPPWRSRFLARRTERVTARHHRASLGATCTAAGITATIATRALGDVSIVLVWATVALAEAAVAMVLLGVRQWRFAPRPRAMALGLGLATALALVAAYPALAEDQSAWSVVLVVFLFTPIVLIGRVPAARADDAVDKRREDATP